MRLTAAALFYEILRLDLVEIVKALVALAEAGKELLQIVPEVDHGDCNAADNDDTADDARMSFRLFFMKLTSRIEMVVIVYRKIRISQG